MKIAIIPSIKEFYSPILFKDTEYQLSFFTKGFSSGSMNPPNTSTKDLRLDVYISGSAGESSTMRPIKEYHGGMLGAPLEDSNEALTDISLGQYLGSVEIDADTQNIANIVQFVPEDTDTYTLKFVIRKGKIFIKNVQLTANIETGFSPNTTEMNISFRRPIFLPASVEFLADKEQFLLRNPKNGKIHLSGDFRTTILD